MARCRVKQLLSLMGKKEDEFLFNHLNINNDLSLLQEKEYKILVKEKTKNIRIEVNLLFIEKFIRV